MGKKESATARKWRDHFEKKNICEYICEVEPDFFVAKTMTSSKR